jgi:hypothetical protein
MATMPMPDLYQAYWDAIVRRVCSVCLDQATDGSCGLPRRTCALQGHLPLIVQTIASIQSDRMDDYVAAIEAQVCARCAECEGPGACRVRDKGECALSAYLSLVVDAIEEVKGEVKGAR